jgi:hypothetical protein
LYTGIMATTQTTAEMVLYPGASHHFLESGKPSHRVDAVTRLVDLISARSLSSPASLIWLDGAMDRSPAAATRESGFQGFSFHVARRNQAPGRLV